MQKKDLEKMTVPRLREEALKHKDKITTAIHSMKKDELVKALMEVLGIEEEQNEVIKPKKKKKIKTVSKESLKKEMIVFKKEKEEALEGKDKIKVKRLRRKIKTLKRKMKRIAAVS